MIFAAQLLTAQEDVFLAAYALLLPEERPADGAQVARLLLYLVGEQWARSGATTPEGRPARFDPEHGVIDLPFLLDDAAWTAIEQSVMRIGVRLTSGYQLQPPTIDEQRDEMFRLTSVALRSMDYIRTHDDERDDAPNENTAP